MLDPTISAISPPLSPIAPSSMTASNMANVNVSSSSPVMRRRVVAAASNSSAVVLPSTSPTNESTLNAIATSSWSASLQQTQQQQHHHHQHPYHQPLNNSQSMSPTIMRRRASMAQLSEHVSTGQSGTTNLATTSATSASGFGSTGGATALSMSPVARRRFSVASIQSGLCFYYCLLLFCYFLKFIFY